MMMKHIILILMTLAACVPTLMAQDAALAPQQPGALFAYPMAPDTCSTLESRCNYIVTHFWENFDISKPITDDAAFEKTFRDYVGFFPYAHRNVVMTSIRDLVNRAQSNTSNLQKLAIVTEGALYYPTAEYRSDEVYVAFARMLASCQALPKEVREMYAGRLGRINASQEGETLDFEFTDINGSKHRLSDVTADTYILMFLDDSAESSIARVRMSADVAMNALVDSAQVTVVCVCLNKYSNEWAQGCNTYPASWIVGCSDALIREIDLRFLPCCYLLDKDRVILNNSLPVSDLLNAVNPRY